MVKITEALTQIHKAITDFTNVVSELRADLVQHRIEIAILTRFWEQTSDVNKEETYQALLKEYLAKQEKVQKEVKELKDEQIREGRIPKPKTD